MLGAGSASATGCLGRVRTNAGGMNEATLVLAGRLGLDGASVRVGGECTHTHLYALTIPSRGPGPVVGRGPRLGLLIYRVVIYAT